MSAFDRHGRPVTDPQDMTVAEILAATREAMAETIALLKQAREQLEAL